MECKDVQDPNEPCCFCRAEIPVDFSALPLGRYTIRKVLLPEMSADSEEEKTRDVLSTRACPAPLCFIDLLFTRLNQSQQNGSEAETGVYPMTGVYPIPNLWADEPANELVIPVHYELRFRSRATVWQYFIVPKPQSEPFLQLRIEAKGRPQADFGPAKERRLPNGQHAYCIQSKDSLPLQQRSKYHLQLKGQQGFNGRDRVIVDHLPVAAASQVTSRSEDSNREVYSEIYVYI